MTPAAVSQQIKALEDYLGQRLFRRLTRALELTPQGLAVWPKVHEAFECLAAAIESTRRAGVGDGDGDGDGVLTIKAPPSFASRWLLPRLPQFHRLHPEFEVRLDSHPDAVDKHGEQTDLELEPIDPRDAASVVAIRYGRGDYPAYLVQKIFAPSCIAVCSPSLLAAMAWKQVPGELSGMALIQDDTLGADGGQAAWTQWLQAVGASEVDARRGPRFSNATLAIEAALAGQGLALAIKPLAEADLASGRLVAPFQTEIPSAFAYYLLIPKALASRRSILAFGQWLLAAGGG